VLVSSILCKNLKMAYPNAQIHYMVYASTTPVLEGNPYIDHLILFKKEHRKSKVAFFKLLMSIRKERYDLIIDAYSKLESWLTVLVSKAMRKISYKKIGRTFLYTDTIDFLQTPTSNLGLTIERRLSLLKPLYLSVEIDPIPKVYVTEQEREFAIKLLAQHQVDTTKKTVMVSIIGSTAIKTYPLKYMAEVLNCIADTVAVNILFNYMPSQIAEAQQIYEGCKKSTQRCIYFDVLGTSLREYIALMDVCDMIIGNDGGAINIAKSLQKPSFIIFSPWIEKRMWATFEDGKFHKSVHLQDYKPQLFENISEKECKKNSLALYEHFKPAFFFDELKSFLDYNLLHNHTLFLENSIDKNLVKARTHKLSILIITFNEIRNIDSLILNVSFADEIIVVDAFSTDGTVEAVKKYKHVTLVQHAFSNFSEQRNIALQHASHNWVLFIDGDERISEDLKHEISKVLNNPGAIVAYGFYRKFYFNGLPLKFSGYQTDKVFRLFQKTQVRYDKEKLVHETLLIEGNTAILKNKLDHFSYTSDKTYKKKLIKYAKLRAEELYKKKLTPNFYHFYFKPVYRFLYHFIIRLGFLDGKRGYKIARLNAFEVQQRYVALKKLNFENSGR